MQALLVIGAIVGGLWIVGRLSRLSPTHPANALANVSQLAQQVMAPAPGGVSDETAQNPGPLVLGETDYSAEASDMLTMAPETLVGTAPIAVVSRAASPPDLRIVESGGGVAPAAVKTVAPTPARVTVKRRPAPTRIERGGPLRYIY